MAKSWKPPSPKKSSPLQHTELSRSPSQQEREAEKRDELSSCTFLEEMNEKESKEKVAEVAELAPSVRRRIKREAQMMVQKHLMDKLSSDALPQEDRWVAMEKLAELGKEMG